MMTSGFGARGKGGEAAQIAKHRDDVAPLLRRAAADPECSTSSATCGARNCFSLIDALRFLLRGRELHRHLVEANCQLLQLVAAGDHDAVSRIAHAPTRSTPVLQLPDRPRHAVRPPIGERKRDQHADQQSEPVSATARRGSVRTLPAPAACAITVQPASLARTENASDRLAVVAGHDRRHCSSAPSRCLIRPKSPEPLRRRAEPG